MDFPATITIPDDLLIAGPAGPQGPQGPPGTGVGGLVPTPFTSLPEAYYPEGIPFVEGLIGVNRNGPANNNPIIYFNTTPGAGYTVPFSNNAWGWVSMAGKVPVGTKAIHLIGIMSVMVGTDNDGGTNTIAFSAGDYAGAEPPYILEAVAIGSGQGTRECFGVWVPLAENLSFKFKAWWRSNTGSVAPYPQGCAYFASVRMDAYLR